MFERGIIQLLAAWKTDVNRKPLVIHGARQVGKTWALKYFGQKYFEDPKVAILMRKFSSKTLP